MKHPCRRNRLRTLREWRYILAPKIAVLKATVSDGTHLELYIHWALNKDESTTFLTQISIAFGGLLGDSIPGVEYKFHISDEHSY